MRVKIMHSQTKQQIGSDAVIIPTDDERFKIIAIPIDVFAGNQTSLSTAFEVQKALKSCEVSDLKATEVFLPSFKFEDTLSNVCLTGTKVGGLTISECNQMISIETTKGLYPTEGLTFKTDKPTQYMITQPFIFGNHSSLKP
jgi:hypothetical protein